MHAHVGYMHAYIETSMRSIDRDSTGSVRYAKHFRYLF